MNDERFPKQLLYGELEDGRRLVHKPKMKCRDCFRIALTQTRISVVGWERERHKAKMGGWRERSHNGCLRDSEQSTKGLGNDLEGMNL